MLFGAGALPENVEPCVERRYFSQVHYLALTSADADLKQRLRARPAWRQSSDEAHIELQVHFNRWLRENEDRTEPAIEVFNTTGVGVDETVEWVASWIAERSGSSCLPGRFD